jgi:ribonuclease HII
MLFSFYTEDLVEAGCDEAGRGCLAGPVFAAAVILHKEYKNQYLNDSKKLTDKQRRELRPIIENDAVAWAVSMVDNVEIDKINILNASIKAMHLAVSQLIIEPQLLLIDGNRFKKYENFQHKCIIKGDSIYLSIAAASILAKTYRDDFMNTIHEEHPEYGWIQNKGYPTKMHRSAIQNFGITSYHRKSFNMHQQTELF